MRYARGVMALFILFILFATPASAQNYDIIVVFGQSNSTAAGQGSYYDPLQSPTVDSRIMQLGRYGDHQLQIIPALQTFGSKAVECLEAWRVSACTTATDRHGFIIAFARRYVVNKLATGRKVLIVSAGLGATSVLQWNGSLVTVPESALLYSDMVGRLKYLLSIKGNRLISLNFSLLETDFLFAKAGAHGMTAERFGNELRKLFANLRDEFPNAPIITTKMTPKWFAGNAVKAAIESELVSATRAFGGRVTGTPGLTSNPEPEPMHFNAQSMRILGQQHWDAWVKIAG